MASFKDHFSPLADIYAASRPTYPDTLFRLIADVVTAPARAKVWEPGCGNGQATHGLAAHFGHVYATDPSAAQIERHWALRSPVEKVDVAVELAEEPSLEDQSVDVIAVAQALHWFDRPRFFASCERVLKPGGILAAWTYQDIVFTDDLADEAEAVRDDIDPYWPPERNDVDVGYTGYAWPFDALPTPDDLWMYADWTLPQLLGYFSSLSASACFHAATGRDPIELHGKALTAAWGDPGQVRRMRWPVVLHLRRKPGG